MVKKWSKGGQRRVKGGQWDHFDSDGLMEFDGEFYGPDRAGLRSNGGSFIIHRSHVTSDKYLATGFCCYTKFFSCHSHDPDVTQGLHKIHNAGRNYEFGPN